MQVPHPHALLHLPVFRGPGDGAQIQGAGNDHSELYANLFTRYYDAHITFGLFVPIHALLRRPPTVLPSPCPLSATHTLLRRSRTVLPSPRPLSVTLPALSPSLSPPSLRHPAHRARPPALHRRHLLRRGAGGAPVARGGRRPAVVGQTGTRASILLESLHVQPMLTYAERTPFHAGYPWSVVGQTGTQASCTLPDSHPGVPTPSSTPLLCVALGTENKARLVGA